MNKRQAAEQLRKALQMFAMTLTEDKAMEVATVFPLWEMNKTYSVGDIVAYGDNSVGDPQLYKVAQAHTSQGYWLPNANRALYTPIGLNDEGYPVWSQPTGAHDAYNINDIVDFNGELYKSTVDGNTWPPEVYGWERVM